MWLNQSLLPRLLDDSVLLRDTGSVFLGTLRLRQTRDEQSEIVFISAVFSNLPPVLNSVTTFCLQMTLSQQPEETAGSRLQQEQLGMRLFLETAAQSCKNTDQTFTQLCDWPVMNIRSVGPRPICSRQASGERRQRGGGAAEQEPGGGLLHLMAAAAAALDQPQVGNTDTGGINWRNADRRI